MRVGHRIIARVTTVLVATAAASAGAWEPPLVAFQTPPAGPAKAEEWKRPAPPAWLRDACLYEIHVSRFRNGEPANDPPGTLPWPSAWPPERRPSEASQPWKVDELIRAEFGGDYQGVKAKLGYLKDLNVNAILLRPVGDKAPPRDRRIDGRHVDEALSVNRAAGETEGETLEPATWRFTAGDHVFLDLLKEAHRQGIRVVVGTDRFTMSPMVVEPGTAGERFLFDVTKRWMDPDGDANPSDGIDGWWVDSGLERSAFDRRWASHVKKINPQAVILYGLVGLKSPGNREIADGVLTTEPSEPTLQFFRAGQSSSPKWLLDQLASNFASDTVEQIPLVQTAGQQRGLSKLLADVKPPEAVQPLARHLDDDTWNRWRLATIVHHFLPGPPVTRYGDEVGVFGGAPDFWAPMWWTDLADSANKPPEIRTDMAALVRWLHSRRQHYAPLREGKFRAVLSDEERKLFAFGRSLPGDELILLVNYGSAKQKVVLPMGRPGQIIGVLIPHFLTPRPAKADAGTTAPSGLPVFRINGSRQMVSPKGEIRLWIGPMSARVILVTEGELR